MKYRNMVASFTPAAQKPCYASPPNTMAHARAVACSGLAILCVPPSSLHHCWRHADAVLTITPGPSASRALIYFAPVIAAISRFTRDASPTLLSFSAVISFDFGQKGRACSPPRSAGFGSAAVRCRSPYFVFLVSYTD